MKNASLQLQQLDNKLKAYASLPKNVQPLTGWTKAIRSTLGMSLQQLGGKLSISKQSAQDIERREKEGSISLRALREVANAMDMNLVYGFVPKDGSLDALIEKRAKELATTIVLRTANTMKLEDQLVSEERIRKAIEEKTIRIKNEMPKILWD